MLNNRSIWFFVLSTALFFGAALMTLRAAEQASRPAAVAPHPQVHPAPVHPVPSAPEESATISDDPTTAPDPSQSADSNVSFPTDI
jgi:hypothetical protein